MYNKFRFVYSFSPIVFYTRMNFYRKESVSRTYQSYPEQLLQRLCHANVTQRYTDVIRNILIKSDKPWESRSVANPIPISLQEWFVARVRWISRASLIHIQTWSTSQTTFERFIIIFFSKRSFNPLLNTIFSLIS